MPFTTKEQEREYRREYMRRYRARPEWPAYNRAARLKHRYGISQEEFDELFEAQGGVCAICQQPETSRHGSGTVRNLSVDHDHNTGRVRGLLCHSCNRILGLLDDDPERLRRALTYLEGGK